MTFNLLTLCKLLALGALRLIDKDMKIKMQINIVPQGNPTVLNAGSIESIIFVDEFVLSLRGAYNWEKLKALFSQGGLRSLDCIILDLDWDNVSHILWYDLFDDNTRSKVRVKKHGEYS